MKKILLIAFLLSSLQGFSQCYPKACIVCHGSDTVHAGDSTYIDFILIQPPCSPLSTDTIVFNTIDYHVGTGIIIWKKNYHYYDSLPAQTNACTSDSTYRIYYQVPSVFRGTTITYGWHEGCLWADTTFVLGPDAVPDLTINRQLKSKKYYTLIGEATDYPHGIVIEETEFMDGFISRKKVWMGE